MSTITSGSAEPLLVRDIAMCGSFRA